jgi:hypothetical protein
MFNFLNPKSLPAIHRRLNWQAGLIVNQKTLIHKWAQIVAQNITNNYL